MSSTEQDFALFCSHRLPLLHIFEQSYHISAAICNKTVYFNAVQPLRCLRAICSRRLLYWNARRFQDNRVLALQSVHAIAFTWSLFLLEAGKSLKSLCVQGRG